ncbi:MAG TPA: glutaredoxin family protein [Candidatus Saccharimonadales bacterium]|nr:glutaredoxin family protein [Candidatus Saccharimonadales bacterium]
MSDDSSITIYGAEWCGPCHMTKHYLTEKGLKYTYRNIDEDPAAGLEAITKSGERAIPVIDIAGDIVVGFDRPKLDAALKAHKLV